MLTSKASEPASDTFATSACCTAVVSSLGVPTAKSSDPASDTFAASAGVDAVDPSSDLAFLRAPSGADADRFFLLLLPLDCLARKYNRFASGISSMPTYNRSTDASRAASKD